MANLDRQTYKSSWNPNVAEMVIKAGDGNALGTYTASVTIPEGSYLLDVQVHGVELWNAGAAELNVGSDGVVDDIWVDVNLKATDLLVNEVLSFHHQGSGSEQGALLTAANGAMNQYRSGARTITATIVTSSSLGTTGETRIMVMWAKPTDTTKSTFVAT